MTSEASVPVETFDEAVPSGLPDAMQFPFNADDPAVA